MKSSAVGGRSGRLRTWFVDREFFMRSQGQVRFIKISSRVQMAAAGFVVTLLAAWLITMAAIAVSQFSKTQDRLALNNRAAQVASAESRVAAYRQSLDSVASDLEKRQAFLEKMQDTYVEELSDTSRTEAAGEAHDDATEQPAGRVDQNEATVRKISATMPEAEGLARIEARQLAYVERLTRIAERRSAAAAQAIRKLGLNPGTMMASLDDASAQGGPLDRMTTARDGSLDPRFARLGASLARMSALERGLDGIPQVRPANLDFVSSSFGYRSDPFTGGGAFHAGLDFRGPIGAPIYAAAAGRVVFAGVKQGYGNVIDIDHGNGLVTRYAHMSAFRATTGQEVQPGDVIGAIGNTGRSTGPHLHFEVRVNDNPVDPRPFLEKSRNVQQDHDHTATSQRK